jgi:predicted Zn-dependent protease
LGQFYLEANRPQDALSQFNLVKMKEPEPGYYFNLAKAYHQLGEKEKAYDYLIETL